MFFPFFRGKQFELILLRDNAEFIAKNGICPIIEPVKDNFPSLKRAIDQLKQFSAFFIFIINPQVGDLRNNATNKLRDLIENDLVGYTNMSLGYIINSKTTETTVQKVIQSKPKTSFSIIHYGFTEGKKLSSAISDLDNVKSHIFIDGYAGKLYQRHFKKDGVQRILIRDGFKIRKNANYPDNEHFSDLHITYGDEGVDGFGDFLIVGDEYREEGGPAYAVAIHLTYLDAEEDMYTRHFISIRTDSPTDPAGKFLEALNKLVQDLQKKLTPIFLSNAVKEYIDLHKKKHFPGLGYVKKLSMQHHLELIANFLSRG